jgi:hypothetical protein
VAGWAAGEGAVAGDAGELVNGADLLHRTGGIRPAPALVWEVRLSLIEREETSRGLAAGLSMWVIAAGLGRRPQRRAVRCWATEAGSGTGRRPRTERHGRTRHDPSRPSSPGPRRWRHW